ncbi:hypothetical protein ABZZ36_13490 [Actinacidiphila glaucinigra]|uniref:hypothetical protein n=1 Tax=Actinacidiphila glaucinigra TaxID=235986 RepID=UPI0033B69BC4
MEQGTGRRLRAVRRRIGVSTWEGDNGQGLRHEADFVVDVDGDPTRARLEPGKHAAYDWFGPEDDERLKENAASGETLVHDVIAAALDLRG